MTEEVTRPVPDKRLKLNIDGKDVELFMSFGLLDEVIKLFDDDHPVETAQMDNELRKKVVEFMLQPRGAADRYGIKDFNLMDSEITVDQITSIFRFVLDNVTDFFINAGETASEVLLKYQARANSLAPSANGSQA